MIGTPEVEWLLSTYDATWHAFPARQLSDQARKFYEALCGHCVPARHVEHRPPRTCCPTCLVRFGAALPDEQRWRASG